MGTDDLHKRRKQERQSRKSRRLKERAENWLIVCEGEETEPNYFNELLKYVNTKFNKKIKYLIKGTGRNTESLVACIDDFFAITNELELKENIPYGKIFVVFDKDSFTKGQFNNAIFTAKRKGYIPIWSNECIELWFLLHFILLESNIPRYDYFNKLSEKFQKKYDKTEDHFGMLDIENNLKIAMQNARRLYINSQTITSFADRAPCTTVFKFIEVIEEYIGFTISE